jgi:hypothetical protein
VRRLISLSIALFGMILLPCAFAQKAAPAHIAGRAIQGLRSFNGGFRNEYPSAFRRSPQYVPYTSLPFPFFGDALDDGDIYSTGYPVASEPPAYVLQAASLQAGSGPNRMPRGTAPYDPAASSQPLMIELQNGHYVHVSTAAADGGPQELTPAAVAVPPAPNLPSVVLIFRDGHSEEVRDYTIADGILYARGDFYTDGYWNKKIALSALNLAQTLQANNERNVKFVFPASPNEVITRP